MKLCKDCRHFKSVESRQCSAFGNSLPDYVNGGERVIYTVAQAVRIDQAMCGPEAKWFEPRTEQAAEQAAAA